MGTTSWDTFVRRHRANTARSCAPALRTRDGISYHDTSLSRASLSTSRGVSRKRRAPGLPTNRRQTPQMRSSRALARAGRALGPPKLLFPAAALLDVRAHLHG